MFAKIATNSIGNNTLIPNTAMTIHRVRNLFCRVAFICLRTFTLTIALSNDIEVSNNPKTATINIVDNHQMIVQFPIYHTTNPIARQIIAKIVDHKKYFLKVFINNNNYIKYI